MARTKDTEPARLGTLDLNSRAAEKDKKKARAGVRGPAEAAKKRAYMPAMESSSDDELCDDDMRVGGEAQLRGMKPALVFLLLATAALASGLLGSDPSPKQIRERMNQDTNLQRMTRSEFSRMFRMDHLTFLYLLDRLGPTLERDYIQSQRVGGHVSPSLQLGMTLRWLAGGSHLDVAQYYGVSSSTFYDLVNTACDAIVETFPIVFDMSERSLKQRSQEFGQH